MRKLLARFTAFGLALWAGPFVALVDSGQTVSGPIDCTQRVLRGVWMPTITSADLLLRGSHNSDSANFVRVQEVRGAGSGDLRFATGVGSNFLLFPTGVMETLPYAKLETGVAQASPRTLVLMMSPRR